VRGSFGSFLDETTNNQYGFLPDGISMDVYTDSAVDEVSNVHRWRRRAVEPFRPKRPDLGGRLNALSESWR
jgi:hypothetical protein